ncbi:anaerobic ribonucleoside-triphosphate reductase-activating protein [Tepiditoga spiralis]|uniref:Anaerobic ribonucleoside-triphosphate reductase-activating protein n=1 Tax=Tepiditoga spiralis TaxID=2108365 RepID=A0A7G1GC44_9BACT|nr:4Fe-4S cluster-binding domain-containing protein [Tepiditoga spiralis]BBE31729.1 anaerobic ribonucleoside-triphosphate reductase-activating protein [Tepiditoga spiralis]
MLEIAGYIEESLTDGPGIRSVVFFQGCSRNCKDCHNKSINEKGKGKKITINECFNMIKKISNNKKITISGGEPLEQYNNLLKLTKKLYENKYDICIYTGNNLKEIPKELLYYINYIKVGYFDNKKTNVELNYYGSKNQKFYKIEKGEKICLKEI